MTTDQKTGTAYRRDRTFGLLTEECNRRGITRTKAFDLANHGLIETFKIGRRRYVRLDSLDRLPDRLEQHDEATA